jgi:hypothetical protein
MEKNRIKSAAQMELLFKTGCASAARLWFKLGGSVRQHRRKPRRERRRLCSLAFHPFHFPRDAS